MKLTFLTMLASLALFMGYSQQVDRDKVIVEIGTGTWCPYCPGAAMGADDLIANGHDVAVIEYHSGDSYQNSYATARIAYYSISGFPTAVFDGVLQVAGGHATQSMYPQYLAKYNQRISIPSSFTLEMEGSHSGMSDYEITVTANKVASTSGTNMVLHFVLTESHIQEYWQGMDELNFVERLMRPNQNGTTLDFTGSNTQEVNISFTMNQDWDPAHCEVVAFIQDINTKEALQGTKMALSEFPTGNSYDAGITGIYQVPVLLCDDSFAPLVSIGNYGAETLTSLDIAYQVNSNTAQTYSWTGSLDYLEFTQVILGEMNPAITSNNTLTVELENPNGEPDQYPQNNSLTFQFESAGYEEAPIYLVLKTDEYPEETTWELTDNSGNILYSGGPYTQPNNNVFETFDDLDIWDCYHFIIYDAGGDGLTGSGLFKLADASQQFFAQGKDFGPVMEIQFNSGTTGLDEEKGTITEVYPNPFTNRLVIECADRICTDISVSLFNGTGQMITRSQAEEGRIVLDTERLPTGIYNLKIVSNGKRICRKVLKK